MRQLISLIQIGMSGVVEVAGVQYNGVMPPWRNSLADTEVAAVGSL